MGSSFSMNTTDSRENGRYQTSIDLTEYMKHDGAEVVHSVCVSATQSRSLLHDPLRILKSKTYSGLTRGLVGLTKSIHALGTSTRFSTDPLPATTVGCVALSFYKGKRGSDHSDTPEWTQQAMEVSVERNKLFHACSRTNRAWIHRYLQPEENQTCDLYTPLHLHPVRRLPNLTLQRELRGSKINVL